MCSQPASLQKRIQSPIASAQSFVALDLPVDGNFLLYRIF